MLKQTFEAELLNQQQVFQQQDNNLQQQIRDLNDNLQERTSHAAVLSKELNEREMTITSLREELKQ